jgi:CO dehydrogenase nickel-insertion accessory protein CooC1
LTAGKIGDLGPGAGCDGPINKIARDVRIFIEGGTPVTLVDFKAGFEDSARGAITSLDWVLAVVDPTHAAIQMAIHMKEMLRQMKAGKPPATEHLESPELVILAQTLFREANVREVLAILNRVRDREMEGYLRDKLSEGNVGIIGVVREDPSLTSSWLKGLPLNGPKLREEAEGIVTALENAEKGQS